MKIGSINIVNSSEYQKLIEENERLHTNIQTLETRLQESRKNNTESQKIFSYLMTFYYTVQDSMEGICHTMKEYGERKKGNKL